MTGVQTCALPIYKVGDALLDDPKVQALVAELIAAGMPDGWIERNLQGNVLEAIAEAFEAETVGAYRVVQEVVSALSSVDLRNYISNPPVAPAAGVSIVFVDGAQADTFAQAFSATISPPPAFDVGSLSSYAAKNNYGLLELGLMRYFEGARGSRRSLEDLLPSKTMEGPPLNFSKIPDRYWIKPELNEDWRNLVARGGFVSGIKGDILGGGQDRGGRGDQQFQFSLADEAKEALLATPPNKLTPDQANILLDDQNLLVAYFERHFGYLSNRVKDFKI